GGACGGGERGGGGRGPPAAAAGFPPRAPRRGRQARRFRGGADGVRVPGGEEDRGGERSPSESAEVGTERQPGGGRLAARSGRGPAERGPAGRGKTRRGGRAAGAGGGNLPQAPAGERPPPGRVPVRPGRRLRQHEKAPGRGGGLRRGADAVAPRRPGGDLPGRGS